MEGPNEEQGRVQPEGRLHVGLLLGGRIELGSAFSSNGHRSKAARRSHCWLSHGKAYQSSGADSVIIWDHASHSSAYLLRFYCALKRQPVMLAMHSTFEPAVFA
ncbi:hypothetical protein BP6252_12422 [Coleophoma cylindrospora]|uniref:Uncharacterized protein n=1 Tax=Coleophoma cylindrospora TaxID=1849047 RepID=A0A3D8QGY2_9HELO|nr:hypothetical protein BP6252_12422 [Coleophoma cylindrospora]